MIDSALVTERGVTARDEWITVPAERIREALSALKADGYRMLVFLTCVDHLVDSSREFPARYEIVYQLRDLEKPANTPLPPSGGHRWGPRDEVAGGAEWPMNTPLPPSGGHRWGPRDEVAGGAEWPMNIRVRTFVGGDSPRIDSVHDLFPPANWEERETYDMFGIVFSGHPDLTRILMPDDWVGHPLRRDFPVGGEIVEFSEEHAIWQTAPDEA